jgi:hypothetical protein
MMDICFYETLSTHLLIEGFVLLFKLDSVYTQTSLLGIIITSVNNFHLDLVVMIVCFCKIVSVIALIYLRQLCFITLLLIGPILNLGDEM